MTSPRQSAGSALRSPRRSPRLSTGTHGNIVGNLQASAETRRQRQESPLTSRHTIAAGASSYSAARRSLSPSKQRLSSRPVHENNSQPSSFKVARRAYSVGGARHTLSVVAESHDEENDSLLHSRRNVPGPRKSAIRTGPPQVFASPTEVSPPPGIRPLAARLSNGFEAIGGPDLKNLIQSINILRSPKGKERYSAEPEHVDPSMPRKIAKLPRASSVPTALDAEDPTITRKRRRVTFNPFQENANFEKDEPTIHIYPTGEAIPLPETSVSTNNDSSDMSIASTSSSSVSSGQQSEDAISFNERDESDDDAGNDRGGSNQGDNESNSSEDEVEEEVAGDGQDGVHKNGGEAANDESAMDMTHGYGGLNESTVFPPGIAAGIGLDSDVNLEDSAMDLETSFASRGANETITMQFTSALGKASVTATHPRLRQLRSYSDDEDESSIDQELSALPQKDSPAPTQRGPATAEDDLDDGSSAMDMTDIVDSRSSPQRMSSSPQKSMSPARSPRRSPRKSISHLESFANADDVTSDVSPPATLRAFHSRGSRTSDSRGSRDTADLNAANGADKENATSEDVFGEDVFGTKPAPLPRPASIEARRSSAATTPRASRAASARHSPSKAASPSTPRRTLHELSTNSSPRLGHEYCGLPASETPKARLSAATLKMQARRESLAHATGPTAPTSPSKSPVRTSRASIGTALTSPAKSPFQAKVSQQKPVQMRAQGGTLPQSSRAPVEKQLLAPPGLDDSSKNAAVGTQSRISSARATPDSPRRRPSSPLRPPGTPSRTWQSFREGQSPTTPKSPARRITLSRGPTPSKQTITVATPQRLNFEASIDRVTAGRSLSVTLRGTPTRRSAAQDASAVTEGSATQPVDVTDGSRVTMKHFFETLNMGFLDLSAPTRRRITPTSVERLVEANTPSVIRAACGIVPFLDSLNDACRELKTSVDDGRQLLTEHEREFHDTPPSYVAEVLAMTSSAEKTKATASFKLQKSAARAIAQKAYYGWRTDKQFDDAALTQLQSIREKLRNDLESARVQQLTLSNDTLPCLREHHSNLRAQLAESRAKQQKIDNWDREEMRAMHAAMEEQGSILEQQRASHAEGADQLQRLRARLDDLTSKKTSAEAAIAEAHAASQVTSGATRVEAARLARHIGHLESLHLWSLHKAEADRLHLVLDSRLNVLLDLTAGQASTSKSSATVKAARVHLLQQRECSEGMYVAASILQEALLDVEASQLRPAEVIRFIGMTWTRARHADNVARRLELHYPVQVEASQDALAITTCILVPRARSKVVVRLVARASALMDPRADLFAAADVAATCVYGSRGKDVGVSLLHVVQDALSTHRSSTQQRDVVGVVVSAVKTLNATTLRS